LFAKAITKLYFVSLNINNMKQITLFICTVVATCSLLGGYAQNTDPMKAWQNFMTPGDHHKRLAKEVGTWEAEVSQWMDPGAPPSKSKATNVVTMAMNGLYQMGNFSSTMMGMPMMGQSTVGYDNAQKMYVLSWIDNMGSGIVKMTGNYDEATKMLSLKGKQTDPMTGGESDIREEIKYLDDNAYTMAMYGAGMDGKEMKFMEGTFRRKK
jgi:Protein of unknown function (DUF1579)